jgi:restriction system protein
MAKKRNTFINLLLDLFEGLFPIYVLYLIYLWFTNKANFWRWVIYAILYILIIVAIVIWRRERRFKMGERWLSDRELLQMLRGKTPIEFEDYIADLFTKLGYKAEAVGGSYDEGVDVVAEKDGIKHYIQCKKFITSQVSVGAVRDFYGSIADHLATGKGYFITTNKFTLEAERFAEDKPIELIDSFKLIKYIRMAEEKKETMGNKIKNCPKCGGNLIERTGKYGKFYGCSNYPKCQYTENILK